MAGLEREMKGLLLLVCLLAELATAQPATMSSRPCRMDGTDCSTTTYGLLPSVTGLNGTCLAIAGDGAVYRSTDYGVTWSSASTLRAGSGYTVPYFLAWTGRAWLLGTLPQSPWFMGLFTSVDGVRWIPRVPYVTGTVAGSAAGPYGNFLKPLGEAGAGGYGPWQGATDGAVWITLDIGQKIPTWTSDIVRVDGMLPGATNVGDPGVPTGTFAIMYDGAQFIIVKSTMLARGTVAADWTTQSVPFTGCTRGAMARRPGGRYVFGCLNNTSHHIWYSDDLTTWTGVGDVFGTLGSDKGALNIVWTGTRFVARGYGTTSWVATSPDGATWTPQAGVGQIISTGRHLAWNGTYVISDNLAGTGIVYSADGLTWNNATGYAGISISVIACSPEPMMIPPVP